MRQVRALVALAVVAASLFWTAGTAHACSCAMPNAAEGLASSDATFVGTFVGRTGEERRGGDFGPEVGYGFEVESWLKGDGPASITVWSSGDGASCGIEARPGQRVGIFARERGGELQSDLCSTINADLLLAATSSSVVVGEGPVHFVLAGGFAEGSIAYLDSRGRPLGYLAGPQVGGWVRLESCPGGETAVLVEGAADLQIIDLASGEQTSVKLDIDPETASLSDVECLTPDGSDISILIEQYTSTQLVYAVGRIDPEPRKVNNIPAVRGGQPMLAGTKVIIAESNESGGRVRVFDPETGAMTTVAEVERDGSGDDHAGYDQPMSSPDGRRVAIVESVYGRDGDVSNTVIILDLETGDVRRSPTADGERWGIAWLGDDMVGAPRSTDGESFAEFVVLDADTLEEVAVANDFTAHRPTTVDGEIWGVDGSVVQRVSLAGGDTEVTHTFAASTSGELFAVGEPFDAPAVLTAPAVGGAIEPRPPTAQPAPEGDGGVDVAVRGEERIDGFDSTDEGDALGANGSGNDDSGTTVTIWAAVVALAVAGLAALGLIGSRSRSGVRSGSGS